MKLTHTCNSLPKKTGIEVAALLQARLADFIDLMMPAKQAHWNVKGSNFIALHELFDKVYTDTGVYVDIIAERIVQLGGMAQGTIRAAAKASGMPEYLFHAGFPQSRHESVVRGSARAGRPLSPTLQSNPILNPMNKNPLNKGMIEENSVGIGEISSEMVAERAKELALIAGRPVTREDHEQALRELTGGIDLDAKQALLESFSEDERWDPVPGSTGHQAEESASEDEDADGRGENAQLVEEGVSEAEHDQMLQAARAAKKKDLSDQ